MKTEHKIVYGDSRSMKEIKSGSVDLMITSPPYPMIQMWDEMFSKENPKIKLALFEGNGEKAFELIHRELDKTWGEVYRALKEGGIACINIGDATRTLKEQFQIYPNHARILNYCLSLGFHALPGILWIKETNKPDKFMGSGMLPIGAYVTLEHEHILILRKGRKRAFKTPAEKLNRQRSAFFWEERNVWFSDKWHDINGVFQKLDNPKLRARSGAYPLELAYRLISMFSVQGDTVLDPFLGTGTTAIAAMATMRNSIGYEFDENFKEAVNERIGMVQSITNDYNQNRIRRHKEFIAKQPKEKAKYLNANYNLPVITKQETGIWIPRIKSIRAGEGKFSADYY